MSNSNDSKTSSELPLATPEYEQFASALFADWETTSPPEWAARYSHTIGCSSFDQYRYRDNALQAWIYQLHTILMTRGLVQEYRMRFLSADEIQEIDNFEF